MHSNTSPYGDHCLVCDASGFVCVHHRDRPWAPVSNRADACGCSAGTPCRLCNSGDVPVERLENNVVYLFGKPHRLD